MKSELHFTFVLLVRLTRSYRSPWVREKKDLLLQHPALPSPSVLRVQKTRLAPLLFSRITHPSVVLHVSNSDVAAAGSQHTPYLTTIQVFSSGSGVGHLEVPVAIALVACKQSQGAAHARS